MREREKIAFIVVAAQRKFESILSGGRAVARARAATGFGQHRLNVIAEAPFKRFVHVIHRDLRRGGLIAPLGPDGCRTIADRHRDTVFDGHDIGIAGTEIEVVRDLPHVMVVTKLFQQ